MVPPVSLQGGRWVRTPACAGAAGPARDARSGPTCAPKTRTTALKRQPASPMGQTPSHVCAFLDIQGMELAAKVGFPFRLLFFVASPTASPRIAIDNCKNGANNCSTVASVCTFTGPGTFACSCNPGYTGDGYSCQGLRIIPLHFCLFCLSVCFCFFRIATFLFFPPQLPSLLSRISSSTRASPLSTPPR